MVFQELEPNQRWTLKGWSLEASTVVSQQDAGLQEPRPSALHGNARIDGGTRQWDPRIQSGGEGSPDPNPIETTIINPATYNCSSLENMKVANNFALLAGKNCGPGQDTKTFAVSMQDDNFVANYFPVLYQPFLVSEDSDSVNFTALNNWIAYKDGPDLVLTEVDRDKLQIIRPYFTPFDNNYTMPVPLSPWNLTATSFGSIDYAGSGLYQDYKVHLAENRTYRIYAISGGNCFAWHDATRITVTWPDGELTTRTNDTPDTTIPPNCAATDFTVGTRNTEIIVRVDRRDRGVEGLAPPLEYELFVEPL